MLAEALPSPVATGEGPGVRAFSAPGIHFQCSPRLQPEARPDATDSRGAQNPGKTRGHPRWSAAVCCHPLASPGSGQASTQPDKRMPSRPAQPAVSRPRCRPDLCGRRCSCDQQRFCHAKLRKFLGRRCLVHHISLHSAKSNSITPTDPSLEAIALLVHRPGSVFCLDGGGESVYVVRATARRCRAAPRTRPRPRGS
jgi:hypothetical protein